MKIKADEFEKSVMSLLEEYGDEVYNVLGDAMQETADHAVKSLKNVKFKTGKTYSKGWKSQVDEKWYGYSAVIYNAKQYYLTHLLEYGHAKQNGGRVAGQEHIYPVDQDAEKEIVEIIERKLGQ